MWAFKALSLSERRANVPPELSLNGLATSTEKHDKHEAAVLRGKAEYEGWSEEKLTAALNDLAVERPSQYKAVRGTEHDLPKSMSVQEALRWQKKQETTRITRQADNEGWSDDKILAALRLRNSVHYELRSKVRQA
ncbi:hypothetical protein diail_10501 [Diaporthe ilicicola]|nr:hypothetical protein diail_10501 [Diaporthe ilicicola]